MLLSGWACKQLVIKKPHAVLSTARVGSVGLLVESPPPATFLQPAVQSLPQGPWVLAPVLTAFSSHTTNKEHALITGCSGLSEGTGRSWKPQAPQNMFTTLHRHKHGTSNLNSYKATLQGRATHHTRQLHHINTLFRCHNAHGANGSCHKVLFAK